MKRKPKTQPAGQRRAHLGYETLQPRHLMAGDIDIAFGGNGFGAATTDMGGTELMRDLAHQSDGKLISAGFTTEGGGGKNFALARFHSNGTLDTSFGGAGVPDGTTITDFDQLDDRLTNLFVLPDDTILAIGESQNDQTGERFASLARYDANGLLDETFGFGGRLSIDVGSNQMMDAAIGGGRILLVTSNALIGLTMDGAIDNLFGGDGHLTEEELGLPAEQYFYDADYGDGKFVIGTGTGNATARVLRMDTNGVMDTTFGVNGISEFAGLVDGARISDVIVSHTGDVLGAMSKASVDTSWIFRLTDQGALDGNFHANGIYETPAQLDFDPNGIVEMLNGSIVVIGNSHATEDPDIAVLRLSEYGEADPSFGSDGWGIYNYNAHVTGHTALVFANNNVILGGSTMGFESDFFLTRIIGFSEGPGIDFGDGLATPQLPPIDPWHGQTGRGNKILGNGGDSGDGKSKVYRGAARGVPGPTRPSSPMESPVDGESPSTELDETLVDQLFSELDPSNPGLIWLSV